jgi:beta-galactosidase
MNQEQFRSYFPVGSHLCREPMPSLMEMKKDMDLLKKNGFNLVKLQENWALDEPLEGFYDFTKYEELISYAARLEMGVYLGLTCEQAPNWLWFKHPGCRMVGRNGLPIAYQAQATLPADGKPGPCYDHPGAMADQLRFIKKLVEVLGPYENIVVWNTWQEIGYWSESLGGQPVCYCENTLGHFQRWLRERYGNLDNLNRAWNSRYLDWGYVLPDRLHGRVCLPNDIDWKYFMDNVQIGHVLSCRAQVIRETDPLQRPVFAHKGAPVIGSGTDWTYARTQDFVGSSCYPAWGSGQGWDDVKQTPVISREDSLAAEMWDGVALKYDYIRSCNRRDAPIWAAEFQGGPVSTGFHYGRIPSQEDIRRWMLTAVGSGVTAISFWVTRAEICAAEMNGFSLLDSEGDTTHRLEEAGRVGQALNRHADLFAEPSWGGASTAILVNEWNYQLCMSMAQGGDNLPYSLRGWYKMFWDAGIPVDFLEVSGLDEEQVKEYKAIVLPFPLSISEEIASKLEQYVQQGGNLISEACPGRLNDHGFANRGELSPVLRKLFGVTQTSLKMVREPGDKPRWSPQERTWGEYLPAVMLEGVGYFSGKQMRANVYIETFTYQSDCTPILRFGEETAGVMRKIGSGKAWLLGTFAGHNGTAYRDSETRSFVLVLLKECGVERGYQGQLLRRKRVGCDKEAWLLTNPTGADITESIDVRGWSHVEDLMGEKLQVMNGYAELIVKGLAVRVLVVSGRTAI